MKKSFTLIFSSILYLFVTNAWALDQKDGVYQIGSGEDLVAFSELVNGGENTANAVLTADIDMTEQSSNFLPIGTAEAIYSGTFDGQGHRIKNFSISLAQDCVGVFGLIQSPAIIKNFVLDESCTIDAGGNYCAIIGQARGNGGPIYMENLGMEGKIHLTGWNGAGIIGNNKNDVATFHMKNCYVTGSVIAEGAYSGALSGWAAGGGTFENCWVTGDIQGTDNEGSYFIRGVWNANIINCYCKVGTQATTITDEQVASGELCYLLNGDQSEITWYQTIGEDAHPVLDATHGKVYTTAEKRCDGKIIGEGTYTNDASQASVTPVHQYENDVCTICGQFNPDFLEMKDGFYQIADGAQFVRFSKAVNAGNITFNGQLTADIDMTDYNETFQPIGCASAIYSGTFDGQGHRIKNLSISIAQDFVGVFGLIQSPAIIKNFVLDESCTIDGGGNYCAIIGQARGNRGPIYMENLGMEGKIHLTGWNGAGIIGNNNGDAAIIHMKNCYVTGDVIAEGAYSGALTAWAGANAVFENCWVTGQIHGTDDPSTYFIRGMSSGSITNCYSKYGSQVTVIDDSQVESGELCYKLNGNQSVIAFYQTIGEDAHPVLDVTHSIVYATAERRCDGQFIGEGTYSNDASQSSVIPDHNYENGVCIVCGQKQEGFMEPDAEGFYNISEASQLVWFASAVNNGEGALNARLTADIDMTEENSKFQPIGSARSLYSGTFDGQGHRIKNLSISLGQDCVGVFGVIQSPAIIKNFVLDESCTIEASGNYCAIIGQARGNRGPIYMENLGMEGSIHLTGWNGAGIIGNNMGDAATFHMKNCYVTGSVIADGAYSGALSGWAAGGGTFENCWVTGDIQGTDDNEGSYFIRGVWNASIINCYSKVGTQATTITDEQVTSGELCYLLNGKSFYNPTWFQTIDEDSHPVLDPASGTVYKVNDEYGDVHDEASFEMFKDLLLGFEEDYCDTVIAEQALIDVYEECIEALEDYSTMEEFAAAYNDFKEMRVLIESSAKAYAAYQAKVDDVTAYLEEHNDFEGDKRDELEYYLTENDEPSELYPNGTSLYILEMHTMSEEEIKAETAKIDQMLEEAIATGFILHSNITSLLTNADFSNGFDGWKGEPGHSTSSPCAECKNKTCDFYQTLTDLRNGVYELQVNGFFRPGNPYSEAGNPTSTNYGAFFYVNDMQNYLMAAIEDMISVDDAVDGENCYITEGAAWTDYSIYDDDGNLMGYVPGGQGGLKIAAKAGRYQNRILVNVTDGQLTLGFKLPGTGVANDCMDIANIMLFYHGTLEEASAQIDETLLCMTARAQTLYDYEASYGSDYAEYPNYSAELRSALKDAIDAAGTISDVEGKYALLEKFSDLFQQVYNDKKVYIALMDEAETLMALLDNISPVLTYEEAEELNDAIDSFYEAYSAGTATWEMIEGFIDKLTFMPKQKEGVYQIDNGSQLTVFSVLVNSGNITANAVLTDDIDMTDYSEFFQPIGCESAIYSGTFDGQGHKISNLSFYMPQDCVGLFGMIQSPAIIKNFVLDESCSIEAGGNYCAIIGQARGNRGPIYMENLGMEGSIHLTGWNGAGIIGNNMGDVAIFHMKNCYVTGSVTALGGYSGALSGWAAGGGTFENCWVTGDIQGTDSESSYFIRGVWNASIINCYSKVGTQATTITDEQVASGELCYLLNGDQREIVWYQTIGEDAHPVFDESHQIVIFEDGKYDNPDGIKEIKNGQWAIENDGAIYDLAGRRVSSQKVNGNLPKGIYIINGKKIMVN